MTTKTTPKITLWEFFQQLGKTFMLPVALLSFCGIMLGIGSSLSSHDVITLLPVLGNPLLQAIFTWMSKVGSFAFSFLPVMFCIAIPLGLARENKGVAAFAGFVGYAVMNLAVNFWLTAKGILPTTDAAVLKANNVQNILGIPSIDTGILGAVIAGIIVWMLHERFHTIRLPDALAFFGGTRFVPIVSAVVMGLVGLVIPLVWPVFAMGISGLGHIIKRRRLWTDDFRHRRAPAVAFWSAPYSGSADSLHRGGRYARGMRAYRERRIDYFPGPTQLPNDARLL